MANTAWPQAGRTESSRPLPLELMVLASPQEARSILARLKNGEDFGALAKKYSIDATAPDGGHLGSVDPGNLRLELRDALRGVGPGQLTGVVPIPTGYAILKRLIEEPPGNVDRERALDVSGPLSVRVTHDSSGYQEMLLAIRHAIPADDPHWGADLKQVCEVREQAPRQAIAMLRERLQGQQRSLEAPDVQVYTQYTLGALLSATGQIDGALREWEEAYGLATSSGLTKTVQTLEEVLAVGYLRRASLDTTPTGPVSSSQLVPSHPGGTGTHAADVENAIQHLGNRLKTDPSDLESEWLLNLAWMEAGKYPASVPAQFRVPPSVFASGDDVGRFIDVAPSAGVNVRGMAGGVIVDDFEGTGLLDIVTSQIDDCAPLRLFHNNGDGTFTDRARQAGLENQVGGLNLIQADYNNDGCIDILVLRGGWEFPRRRSLLRNNCDGTFTDVTVAAGLQEPMRSSQSAVWVDIDNDGRLDLFIANENQPSQLFRNNGDGTFTDISRRAGIDQTAFSKAVVAADYDNDGYPDLFVSNYTGSNFLYHNNGDLTFSNAAASAGVEAPRMSFAAWFFDYDNDGWPDLFVTGYFISTDESVRSYLKLPRRGETLKLYRNLRNGKFQDVTAQVGLDRVFMPMGCNFGDVDNDGFLDFYMGMGDPSLSSLLPNTLFHNDGGKRFVDITTSAGVGAIAKGHGVAFADLGNNGNEDMFAVMGGPYAGAANTARLFANPGNHGNHWITLRLVGVKSNRSAIGARITVTVETAGDGTRRIVRTVGSGGSFGASPLQQHIGIGKAAGIENIEVWWPASKTRQNFAHVTPDQFLQIREFEAVPHKLARRSFHFHGE
jgi:tetratricopeptide (TPR) repeat protein